MQKLTTLAFLLGGLSTVAMAQPVNVQDQQQWLLEQVRIGEALYREDLVRDSLARLSLIIEAHFRGSTATIDVLRARAAAKPLGKQVKIKLAS